LYSASSWHI